MQSPDGSVNRKRQLSHVESMLAGKAQKISSGESSYSVSTEVNPIWLTNIHDNVAMATESCYTINMTNVHHYS